MKKIKKLCGIKKTDYKEFEKEIINIVKKPLFICKKCLRVAKEDANLCSAKKI